MSARERGVSTEAPEALDAEGPLRRWARRKREAAREKEAAGEARSRAPSLAQSESVGDVREPAGDAPAPVAVEEKVLSDEDMPPIDSLDENSDYSGFLSPGVSEGLRRRALRKLFMSAVFNVRDGLDDYDEDFTSFEALGDVVTSDMRHQAEAEAERARRARAGSGPADQYEDDPGPAEAGPTAGAPTDEVAKDEPNAAGADAAGMPGASDHRPGEELGVPESVSGANAAGSGTGAATPEAIGPPARPDGGARDSDPHARTLAGAAVPEGFVAVDPEDRDAAGHREPTGFPASPEPGSPGAGDGNAASPGAPAPAGAPGDRHT